MKVSEINEYNDVHFCMSAMLELGKCMDKLAERGFIEQESRLCAKAANAMYFLCLYARKVSASDAETVRFHWNVALEAVKDACLAYSKAEDEKVMEGVIEGIKALCSYERAKRLMVNYLDVSQSESESDVSKSESSHG